MRRRHGFAKLSGHTGAAASAAPQLFDSLAAF